MLDLTSQTIYDKIYGCWMGKNCGGTLGAPLEKAYGEVEPFDVWWYPQLKEGGIPNDDLEMQLIWLKAMEEVGPAVNAGNLAEYWLNHIGYNWDEYGWARMNMRLGLLPPVSGSYNNWFVDCMGCPIRSEIFACILPGLPRLAARYAYEDAICDHAGGESVYGEMFNTAIESAAFIVSDLNKLLDIGRSYVADGSKTALAIDAARTAHRAGLSWKDARRKVLEATPHYNAQYSPINMGFQTVGLLYGKDFAETICIAVNCGYDTDCTGATVGAVLGIIHGQSNLPEKWTQPLGDAIATNESWGGLKACDVGPNPIPRNLRDLTRRTIAQAIRFSAGHTPSLEDCYADNAVRALWKKSPSQVHVAGNPFTVGVEYVDHPAAVPGTDKKLQTIISNSAPLDLQATCSFRIPQGWQSVSPQRVNVPALGSATIDWSVPIPNARILENSNHLALRVEAAERIAQADVPVVLIGSRRMRISKPFSLPKSSSATIFDHAFEPEAITGHNANSPSARMGLGDVHHPIGHDLLLAPLLPTEHAIYVQAFVYSAVERKVIVGVPTTGSVKTWVNNQLFQSLAEVERFRPHSHKTQAFFEAVLQPGYNEILIKLIRPPQSESFDAHLILLDPQVQNAGIVDLGWTRFPWD